MEKKDNSTRTAFFLNLAFTILELIGGIISGSIAILADSLHDLPTVFPWARDGILRRNPKRDLPINIPTAMPAFPFWAP